MKIHNALVFVSDMKHVTRSYRDLIGLPLEFESPGWTEFASEGATLARHRSDVLALAREVGLEPGGSWRQGLFALRGEKELSNPNLYQPRIRGSCERELPF